MPVVQLQRALSEGYESEYAGSIPAQVKMELSPRASLLSDSSEDDQWHIQPLGADTQRDDDDDDGLHDVTLSAEDVAAVGKPPRPPAKRNGFRAMSENSEAGREFNKQLIVKWKKMANRARNLEDPWLEFCIADMPAEECVRHRYSSVRRTWTTDTVQVKMQPETFARGAMRECFRLKKLSKFATQDSWDVAHNYVAKRYIAEVEQNAVFEDVKLQMDAKLWAGEFNRHNPPKKVDIAQMCVIELSNRPDKPLYHLEHFIEGDYIKYNSNSGFVSEECRQTPQAFSHFTFERSGHRLIVVDVQGVGDLYTDPQIHTADGRGYGDGNLGTKGMALFFHTHACNSICDSLGLTPFDLSATEKAQQRDYIVSARVKSTSACRGSEELCVSIAQSDSNDVMESLRHRALSSGEVDDRSCADLIALRNSFSPRHSSADVDDVAPHDERCCCDHCLEAECTLLYSEPTERESVDSGAPDVFAACDESPRRKNVSFGIGDDGELRPAFGRSCDSLASNDSSRSRFTSEREHEAFWLEERKKSRPACVMNEIERRQLAELQHEYLERVNSLSSGDGEMVGGSVLGQVHLDMARYHELGRFCLNAGEAYDRSAAWFHLDVAAKCGVLEAILTVGKIYLNLPHDLLKDFELGDDDEAEKGLDMMRTAAVLGDRTAMILLAESYETGRYLSEPSERSAAAAARYYEQALAMDEPDADGSYDATADSPRHVLLAKLAELYRLGDGDLVADPSHSGDLYNEAAEAAMAVMKGKLANKYYMLAEEAYAEVVEE